MTLGDTIKLLRNEQGLTQPELAEKAQIEQSYLSKLENDKGTPSFDIINRIALALGMNGMELISRLSHSYIAEKLGHIPEVAAEYASIRERHLRSLKRYYLLAAVCLVLGLGVISAGISEVFFPGHIYVYESMGVIRDGETPWHFDEDPLDMINEDEEAWRRRISENRARIDVEYMTAYEWRGFDYLQDVEGGRRNFHLSSDSDSERWQNKVVSILGLMVLAVGVCTIVFVERFRAR